MARARITVTGKKNAIHDTCIKVRQREACKEDGYRNGQLCNCIKGCWHSQNPLPRILCSTPRDGSEGLVKRRKAHVYGTVYQCFPLVGSSCGLGG